MDLDLKQWKHQQQRRQEQHQQDESEDQQEQTSAKLPKLLLPPHPQLNTIINNNDDNKDHPPPPPPLPSSSSAGSTLPLFVPDHPTIPHQHPPTKPHPSPGMGSYFSMAQWQELELQALIYRYMLSGAPVPPELLHPIKKSLAHQSSSFLHHQPHLACFHHYPQYQPFRFQAGYWGSASMDPEPGRCRRTDGKKWRCSREVVPGQKYCERHVHRGRNRSRKPVEILPTPGTCTTASTTSGSIGVVSGGYQKTNPDSISVAAVGATTSAGHFSISRPSAHSPIDLFQMNKSYSGPIPEFRARNKSGGGQVLRHFFDDWPRTLQEPDVASSTGLLMSMTRNSSSDVSLKLSTGFSEQGGVVDGDGERDRTRGSNWSAGWSPNQVASMGGPLAEALRSSVMTNHSSPTSVLHRLTCGLVSETSLITQV